MQFKYKGRKTQQICKDLWRVKIEQYSTGAGALAHNVRSEHDARLV